MTPRQLKTAENLAVKATLFAMVFVTAVACSAIENMLGRVDGELTKEQADGFVAVVRPILRPEGE
jgi:hypothetical protein